MAADPIRDEAERLVAAAIAAFWRSEPGSGFATGSPECCVCPICRVISAMREPNPELTERVATAAGDLATGVASVLRALSRPRGADSSSEGDDFWQSLRWRARGTADSESEEDDPWHAATTATAQPPPKPMAKKAVKAAPRKAVRAKPAPEKAAQAKVPPERAPAKADAVVTKAAKKTAKKAAPRETA